MTQSWPAGVLDEIWMSLRPCLHQPLPPLMASSWPIRARCLSSSNHVRVAQSRLNVLPYRHKSLKIKYAVSMVVVYRSSRALHDGSFSLFNYLVEVPHEISLNTVRRVIWKCWKIFWCRKTERHV